MLLSVALMLLWPTDRATPQPRPCRGLKATEIARPHKMLTLQRLKLATS